MRDGKPLRDFMLSMGDFKKAPPAVQPIAYQEMLIDAWIIGSNAQFNAKGAK